MPTSQPHEQVLSPAIVTADQVYCARCNGRTNWNAVNPAPLGYCAAHFDEWMHPLARKPA